MSMRLLCAWMMVLLFMITPVFAQDQSSGDGHQPPSADDIVAGMQSKLNLTADQVSAVTPIIEKYTSQREELRQSVEDGTADRDAMRSQMKQLRESEAQDLGQILSEDQMNQWKQIQSQSHKHSSDGGGNGGGN